MKKFKHIQPNNNINQTDNNDDFMNLIDNENSKSKNKNVKKKK